jgi:hypothetical protein
MSLSWFFGSKKKTSDTDISVQATELHGDDYVFVEKREDAQRDSRYDGHCLYPDLPYSLVPNSSKVHQTSSTNSTMNGLQNQNFLCGVPFKLTSDNSSFADDAVNGSRTHANKVLSHILQLNLESFEYDFLVEKSVVREVRDI